MAEAGGATTAGGPEEGRRGGEEEAEAPGGGGKILGAPGHLSGSHTAAVPGAWVSCPVQGCERDLCLSSLPWWLPRAFFQQRDTIQWKQH